MKSLISREELTVLVIGVASLALIAFFSGSQQKPFASVEVQFTDASSGGLAIVPASCPSSPHYSGDCSALVEDGGSGDGDCSPSNVCLSGNVVNSCTGALVQACSYGCSGGCLPPPPPSFTTFTASYVAGGGSGGGSGGPSGGTPTSFTASGHLLARPTLVRAGDPTQLYWNVSGATSCAISSLASGSTDSWTISSSGSNGVTSSPILGQTQFVMVCQSIPGATPASITESQTVNVIPVFQEQ